MSNKPKPKTPTKPVTRTGTQETSRRVPGTSPWPKRLLGLGAAALVVLIVGAILFSQDPVRGIPDGTETFEALSGEHTSEDVYGPGEVPAGGPHDPTWANCGFYENPIRTENVVHSMEHGAVWLTFEPDLDQSEIDRLRGFVRSGEKVLVSPVPGQGAPILATAWGYQLEPTDADDERLEQFVNEFKGSLEAPEPGGSCSGGIGIPDA